MKNNLSLPTPSTRWLSSRAATILVVLAAAFTQVDVAAASDAGSAKERVLTWEGSPGEVSRIELRAGNGNARISAVDDDQIRIRLAVRRGRFSGDESWRGAFRWFFKSDYDDANDLTQAIELKVQKRGSTLVVHPLPHGRSRESKINETWQIEVPRAYGIEIDMNSAEVEVNDLEGGVEVSLGHGEAVVDVPRGALDLQVTVGKIDARVRDAQVGRIELRSQVGDTRLWLDGNRLRYPKPPGPGSEVEVDGDGPDDMRLRVQVGDATLRVD